MPRWPWKRETAEEFIARGRASGPADPRAADQQVIDQLVAHGADLSKPTHVIHFLYLPNEQAAQACSREFARAGFGVRSLEPDRDMPAWALHVDHEMLVSIDSIADVRERLEGAADRFEGDYDGWEAAVTT